MRIAIFGARGRTGRLFVDEALERGHELAVLVRERVPAFEEPALADRVRVVVGDARDRSPVADTVEDTDAAVSFLTIAPGSEPTTALSDAVGAILEALERRGPRRFVLTTNSTVFSDRAVADPYGIIAEEHRRNVARLREGDLDWTVLAPKFLRDGEPGRQEAVVDDRAGGDELSRIGLARAGLDALTRDDWIGHVIGLADPLANDPDPG